jgi:hypothetical protein
MDWRTINTTTDKGLQRLNRVIQCRICSVEYDESIFKISRHTNIDYIEVDGKYQTIPEYSTDLNAAFQLVKDEPRAELAINSLRMGQMACSRWVNGHGWVHGETDDGNLALAICRWFLTADDIKKGIMPPDYCEAPKTE